MPRSNVTLLIPFNDTTEALSLVGNDPSLSQTDSGLMVSFPNSDGFIRESTIRRFEQADRVQFICTSPTGIALVQRGDWT